MGKQEIKKKGGSSREIERKEKQRSFESNPVHGIDSAVNAPPNRMRGTAAVAAAAVAPAAAAKRRWLRTYED